MFLALAGFARAQQGIGPQERLELSDVVDGDSISLRGGKQLRYVGVNAPEWDQPGGGEAASFNRQLFKRADPKKIFYRRCALQETDRYDRILGFVEVNGMDVQAELLKKGLAMPMTIPPCGLIRLETYEKIAAQARRKNLGLWKKIRANLLAPEEAGKHLREYGGVCGKVTNVHRGKKSIHLNFGKDWREDFSVTIFQRDLARFQARGIDPMKKYSGKKVTVYGYIQEYHGPQIIAYSPDQFE